MTTPDYQKALGRKIAAERRRRGLSQPELARMFDRSVAWVSQVERGVQHGGKRIALGHGEQPRVHVGELPNANRLVVHAFPSLEAVEAWVEDVKANREQFHTLGDLTIISVPAI